MDFDLVVIGAGMAARTASMRVRKAGWSVAIIDERPYGGTCPLRGCDPKKMLVAAAEAIDWNRRMGGNGISGELSIDRPELIRFKRTFTDPIPRQHDESYREAGITTLHGTVRFTGLNRLSVGGQELAAKHIVIASGAEPVSLGIPGQEYLLDNEGFMALERLPPRIVFVGGGYIAAEFSHIAARAGAEVTVLQRGDRMLKQFEPELVGWLMESLDRIGIDLRTNTTVTAIVKSGGAFRISVEQDHRSEIVETDLVVHAAGRRPALGRLTLETANVAVEKGRLSLNEFLQSTSNPAVYGAGDSAEVGPPLTPVAGHDGKVIAHNLLNGNSRTPDYRGVPSVAFALPPIARVGMGEEEARRSAKRIRVKCERTSNWYTARREAEPVYGYKTITVEGSGEILGAHLVGPNADEVINLFGVAIRHGLTATELKRTIFAYPTGASDIGYML